MIERATQGAKKDQVSPTEGSGGDVALVPSLVTAVEPKSTTAVSTATHAMPNRPMG